MHKAFVLTLPLTALLAGCQMAPKHVRPELPTAESFPGQYADDVTPGRRATEIGWRDFLVDPQLTVLVERALERNRDLAVAVAQIEEARAQFRIQRADRLPTITGNATGTRSRTPLGTLGGPALGSGSVTFDRYQVGVGVSNFELDFWGRVRNLSEAARAQYLATVEAERAFRLALIRDVSSAFLSSRQAAERMALAEATVHSREEGLRIAQRRLDAGVTSALDFRQSESLLTQAETELAAIRLTKAQADNFLAVLIGGPIPDDLPAPLPLSAQTNLAALSAGLPSDLLAARPDILAAEERLRAARANIGAARAAFFPNISLTGNAGFASTDLDELFTEGGKTWSFGPTISLPIFDFGRLKGSLSVAEARENIAIANYEKAIQTAFQEVSNALAGRRFLAEQVGAQERGTDAQRRIANLARTRYREGVADYLEVLDAERNLFSAEQALLQLRQAQAENLVTLYVALGGGRLERAAAAQ